MLVDLIVFSAKLRNNEFYIYKIQSLKKVSQVDSALWNVSWKRLKTKISMWKHIKFIIQSWIFSKGNFLLSCLKFSIVNA